MWRKWIGQRGRVWGGEGSRESWREQNKRWNWEQRGWNRWEQGEVAVKTGIKRKGVGQETDSNNLMCRKWDRTGWGGRAAAGSGVLVKNTAAGQWSQCLRGRGWLMLQAGIVEQVVFWWDVNKWCFVVLKNHPSTTERLKIRGTGSVGKSECRKPDDLVNARIMERGIGKTILFCTSYWNTLRVGFKILFFFVCIGGGEEWVCYWVTQEGNVDLRMDTLVSWQWEPECDGCWLSCDRITGAA